MKNLRYLLIILIVAAGAAGFFWTKNNLTKSETKETISQKLEREALTAITCKLTGREPKKICNSLKEKISQIPDKVSSESAKIIGDFLITDKEICMENGKPIIYFFGSSSCPHCVWEKPVAQKVFTEFKNEISYHENFDSDKDSGVFKKYSDINPGYVPFLVLGCKYARVGAGENLGGN